MPSESAKKRQAQKRDKRQAAGKKKKPVAQHSDKDDTEQQDIEEKDTAKDEGEQEPEDIDDDCQTPERAASGASIESEVSSELAAVKLTVRSCTGSWIIEKHVFFPHPVHRCPLTPHVTVAYVLKFHTCWTAHTHVLCMLRIGRV